MVNNLDEKCYNWIGEAGVDSVEMVDDAFGPLESSFGERLSTVLHHDSGQIVEALCLLLTDLHKNAPVSE